MMFTAFSLDVVFRKTINMELDDVLKHFESAVDEIPTIKQKLSEMIGDGRLIVFIDDLDRCHVDNTIGILEAIKLFLNANGAVFVVAVDMTSLERAWDLRYRVQTTAKIEGKNYLDKIFQLKLSLPPKDKDAMRNYINWLASSLPDALGRVIAEGCPPNPRTIKRILNLIYFLGKGIEDKKFDEYFPLIVIWTIATICYPKLASSIKDDPPSLVETIKYLKKGHEFKNHITFNQHFGNIENATITEASEAVKPIIKNATEDTGVYNFLRSLVQYPNIETLSPTSFRNVVLEAGLIG
jgi:hypothetical protein